MLDSLFYEIQGRCARFARTRPWLPYAAPSALRSVSYSQIRVTSGSFSLTIKPSVLRSYVDVAGFDWRLREIIRTNKLAGTWFHHVVEEN